MQRSALGLKLPDGMRDMLPAELSRLEELESRAINVCRGWSYEKVKTPGLEYRACVQPDANQDDDLYKFFDKNGRILALRPEFTIPIARMVAGRLKNPVLPLRFCYSGDVYRNNSARYGEFRQVGVELVGSASDLADAEVIALAVEIMKALEVHNFRISLGHNGIFSGLVKELRIEDQLLRELEDGISRKDMVRLEKVVAQSGLPEKVKELLLAMPHLTGGQEIIAKLEKWSEIHAVRQAAESLEKIFQALHDFGVQDYISIDLGILRGFSYYTGAIFEGYLPGVGIPVIEGGRYDSLYADFGVNYPATGFAVNLGVIQEQPAECPQENDQILVYGESQQAVIKRCLELRAEKRRVEMVLDSLSEDEVKKLARSKGISRIVKA